MLFAVLILDLISEKFITEKGWDCALICGYVYVRAYVCAHTITSIGSSDMIRGRSAGRGQQEQHQEVG